MKVRHINGYGASPIEVVQKLDFTKMKSVVVAYRHIEDSDNALYTIRSEMNFEERATLIQCLQDIYTLDLIKANMEN